MAMISHAMTCGELVLTGAQHVRHRWVVSCVKNGDPVRRTAWLMCCEPPTAHCGRTEGVVSYISVKFCASRVRYCVCRCTVLSLYTGLCKAGCESIHI